MEKFHICLFRDINIYSRNTIVIRTRIVTNTAQLLSWAVSIIRTQNFRQTRKLQNQWQVASGKSAGVCGGRKQRSWPKYDASHLCSEGVRFNFYRAVLTLFEVFFSLSIQTLRKYLKLQYDRLFPRISNPLFTSHPAIRRDKLVHTAWAIDSVLK